MMMKTNQSVPQQAVLIYNNALELTNRGDLRTALHEYQKAIDAYPSFLQAYNNIGEIYSRMGDSERAISSYMQALSIDRNNQVLLNLGVEYYNRGKYSAALTHFNEALALKDDFIEGHFYAGMAHFNLKDYNRAEGHFSKVLQRDPNHNRVNYLLSYIYYDWKDYTRALTCLERIKDSAEDRAFVKRYYGFCLYHLGRYNEAVSYLSEAIESIPRYDQFRDYLKTLTVENRMREIGDVKARIAEIEEKMTGTKPTLSECTHLSMLYIFNGEYKKAEELLTSYRLQ